MAVLASSKRIGKFYGEIMSKKVLMTLLSTLFFLPQFVSAGTYEIDPTHSYVGFSVKHLVISNVKGKFNQFSGSFGLDEKDNIKTCQVNIGTASIDTDNEKRDKHLRSPDFFNAEKFPKMTFMYKKIKSREGNSYKVLGDLTMRGVKKEVVLDMELIGKVVDPWGNSRIGLSGKTEVDRKEFGLVWNKALETGGFVVGETVKITLDVEAILKK